MSAEIIEKIGRIPQYYMPSLNHTKDKIAFFWDITGRVELYVMDLLSTLKLANGIKIKHEKNALRMTMRKK